MNEFQLQRELNEKQEARSVYDLVSPATEHIAQILHEKWENSKAEDVDGRERAWMMLKNLRELERYYLKRIKTGDLAELELKRKENA